MYYAKQGVDPRSEQAMALCEPFIDRVSQRGSKDGTSYRTLDILKRGRSIGSSREAFSLEKEILVASGA